MRYVILTANNPKDLEKDVNSRLETGDKISGNLILKQSKEGPDQWIQAMIGESQVISKK